MSTSYQPKYFETLDGVRYPKVSPRETHATVQLSKNGERFDHPSAPWLVFDVSEAFADLDDDD